MIVHNAPPILFGMNQQKLVSGNQLAARASGAKTRPWMNTPDG
jgi:hypothetical protein